MDYFAIVSQVPNLVYILRPESLFVHVSGSFAIFMPVGAKTQVRMSKVIRISQTPLTEVSGALLIAIHIGISTQNKILYPA